MRKKILNLCVAIAAVAVVFLNVKVVSNNKSGPSVEVGSISKVFADSESESEMESESTSGGSGSYYEDYYNKTEFKYGTVISADISVYKYVNLGNVTFEGNGLYQINYCAPEPWYRFNDKCYTNLLGHWKIS